jgi:hypothetical protein
MWDGVPFVVRLPRMLSVAALCDWRNFMLPIENDHLPDYSPSADASTDDRRRRDLDTAKSLAAELVRKQHAKKDPEARNAPRKTGTLTLDKRG